MPTTQTHTVGTGGGRAYSSLSAWESAEQRDLVAVDEIDFAECYDDGLMTDFVAISGWTTDATRFIRIETPTAERHTGLQVTGFKLSSSDNAINLFNVNIRIVGIEFAVTASNKSVVLCSTANAGFIDFSHNLFESVTTGILISTGGTGLTVNCWNNASWNTAIHYQVTDSDPTGFIYNCSTLGGTRGIFVPNNQKWTVKNTTCLDSSTSDFFQTTYFNSASNYNASTDTAATTKAPGANSVTGVTGANNYVNVSSSTEDIHVKNVSADIYQAGTDLSGDSDIAVTDDFEGDSRSASVPSIGADELLVSVTKTATFALDTVTGVPGLASFTADYLIVDRLSNTFSLDVLVAAISSNTFSLDVHVSTVSTFSLDTAVRFLALTETFSLDTLVTPQPVSHSVGIGVGRDYSTISAWETAQQRDLVAVGEIALADCFDDGELLDGVTIAGWTTSNVFGIRIWAENTQRTYGPDITPTGQGLHIKNNVVNAPVFNITQSNVWIRGFNCEQTFAQPVVNVNISAGAGIVKISDMYLHVNASSLFGVQFLAMPSGSTGFCWNVMVSSETGNGIGLYVPECDGCLIVFSNCSTYGMNRGISNNPASSPEHDIDIINCVAVNASTANFSFENLADPSNRARFNAFNATNSSIGGAEFAVLGVVPADAFRDVASTLKDLRLKPVSVLFDAGADRSGATIGNFDDWIGAPHGSRWSIGAAEFFNSWFTLDTVTAAIKTFSFDTVTLATLASTFALDTVTRHELLIDQLLHIIDAAAWYNTTIETEEVD